MRKGIFVCLFLGLMLVLVACGGKDTGGEAEDQGVGSEDKGSSADNTVEIIATDWAFNQDSYTVEAGEEVTMSLVNEEGMHGIVINDLDVEIDGEGERTFTPTEPGEYTIACSIPCGAGHNDMVSTLIVE